MIQYRGHFQNLILKQVFEEGFKVFEPFSARLAYVVFLKMSQRSKFDVLFCFLKKVKTVAPLCTDSHIHPSVVGHPTFYIICYFIYTDIYIHMVYALISIQQLDLGKHSPVFGFG